jgi:hypothetical protein
MVDVCSKASLSFCISVFKILKEADDSFLDFKIQFILNQISLIFFESRQFLYKEK